MEKLLGVRTVFSALGGRFGTYDDLRLMHQLQVLLHRNGAARARSQERPEVPPGDSPKAVLLNPSATPKLLSVIPSIPGLVGAG